jgi:hypothetical protein
MPGFLDWVVQQAYTWPRNDRHDTALTSRSLPVTPETMRRPSRNSRGRSSTSAPGSVQACSRPRHCRAVSRKLTCSLQPGLQHYVQQIPWYCVGDLSSPSPASPALLLWHMFPTGRAGRGERAGIRPGHRWHTHWTMQQSQPQDYR